jgi:hypothetical protein
MTPIFVLSYPRSRTAWLSCYLTGAGVPCFHEAWKYVEHVKELRVIMEAKCAPVVVNSDCSNVFFLPELQAEFPEARYVKIVNDPASVVASLNDSYGRHDYHDMLACYDEAYQYPVDVAVTVDWSEPSMFALWELVGNGQPFDQQWYDQMHGMLVQLMPWQIEADIEACRRHEQDHITRAMARWRTTWA